MKKKVDKKVKIEKKSGNKKTKFKKNYFGSVEYLENPKGEVVEIKAQNGVFRIRSLY